MVAYDALGALIGRSPKAAIPRAMAPRARCLPLIVRHPHARPRPGISPALLGASTGRTRARLTPNARLALSGIRGPRRRGVAALALLAKEQRLEPLQRDLGLTQRRQQPLIRPENPLHYPPVLRPPVRRFQTLQKRLDRVEALLDLVRSAHRTHTSPGDHSVTAAPPIGTSGLATTAGSRRLVTRFAPLAPP